MVLVMTVEAGFGGQALIEACIGKVAQVRAWAPPSVRVQVDGGVTLANMAALLAAGADAIVAGSLVFGAPAGPASVLGEMRAIAARHANCHPPPSFI